MKADVDDINFKYMSDIKRLLDSYDACHVCCAYKSKNIVFRKLPSKLTVYLPKFISYQIDEAEINQQLGVLLGLRIKTEEYDSGFTSIEDVPSLPKRPLMNYPMTISGFFFTKKPTNYAMCPA